MPDTIEDVRLWLANYHPTRRTRALKGSDRVKTVATLYPGVDNPGEIAYMFVNDISSRPTCERCGAAVSWFGNRYARTCSTRCSNLLHGTGPKTQEAMRLKREQDPTFEAERSAKRVKTMVEKYGAKVGPNHRSRKPETWDHLNTKGRITLFERHGVDNPGRMADHADKIVATSLSRHGVENPMQSRERFEKASEDRRKRVSALLPEGLLLVEVIPPDPLKGQANFRYKLSCQCGWRDDLPSETFKFRMRTMSHVCTQCTGISTARSIKERNLCEFVASIYAGTIIPNDRSLLRIMNAKNRPTYREVDIFLPDLSIGIEFCGIHYHSTNDPTDADAREYHWKKHVAAKLQGVRLITIFEDEWDSRRPIIEHRLKAILGVARDDRVFARKCEIRSISAAVARTFCESHHIQGYTPCSHKYGLFQGNELVAVMTFSRPSRAKGRRNPGRDEWELSRFCSSKIVVGGGGRLFRHFVKTENPDHVVTYSDLRWNTGNLYSKMGFTYVGFTRPNYWYVQKGMRINRFALRKTDEDDSSLTEFQNRAAQGWRWIWDCGNAKYVWSRKRSST